MGRGGFEGVVWPAQSRAPAGELFGRDAVATGPFGSGHSQDNAVDTNCLLLATGSEVDPAVGHASGGAWPHVAAMGVTAVIRR